MNNASKRHFRHVSVMALFLLVWVSCQFRIQANPVGGSVSQGKASISGIGSSSVTINQTSANAFINWQSFNIVPGETTTFNQPSSSSVTWNYINDPAASSINGNLNANGYVILQNPNGFTVGGSAVINAHGLVMTTASTPAFDLSGGGSWSFNAPPPMAKIVNYGQINIAGGGSAYLIASDIENNGTISAPNGKIGLYAGQQVLVSMSPDGRGLSARVTLPQGSVDNEGNLIADAGSIAAQAQFVNQNGLVQADSVQNVNGVIELVANSSLNLGATSQIKADGDSTATSPGGFVVLNAGKNTFTDTSGSTISAAGNAGGQNGILEIFGNGVTAGSLQSSYGSPYVFLINPNNITLSTATTSTGSNPTLNITEFVAHYSQIDLQALNNITLTAALTTIFNSDGSTRSSSFGPASGSAALSLTAGNSININNNIYTPKNWDLNLTAGTLFSGTTASGQAGIYLSGNSSLQTVNGDINLWAANEVQVGWSGNNAGTDVANGGTGAIRTIGGGNIDVTAEYGDVNSGSSTFGFDYFASGDGSAAAPYYTPFYIGDSVNFFLSNLGGISTAAGGNVTINAGKDVVSFPTTFTTELPLNADTKTFSDAGTGAFGPEAGNVTINAGGSVYGHFVEANGTATINASQDIGDAFDNVALSLIKGSWNLNAGWDPVTQTIQSGLGNIYLQEVRNPNGVFNNPVDDSGTPYAGYHVFDYDANASVSLTAGNGVYMTGYQVPRPDDAVPILLPPTMNINAGMGGVTFETPSAVDASDKTLTLPFTDYTLFASAFGNLQIITSDGGGLFGSGADTKLRMSDSGQKSWFDTTTFSDQDHASGDPTEKNNETPVVLDISGNMETFTLQVTKLAQITVHGDMKDCTFFGQNLNAQDVTSITVDGQISNEGSFTFATLSQTLPDLLQLSKDLPRGDTLLPPGLIDSWSAILKYAVDPTKFASPETLLGTKKPADLTGFAESAPFFTSLDTSDVTYNTATKTLTSIGPMSGDVYNVLTTPNLTLVVYGPNGYPLLDRSKTLPNGQPNPDYGHFVTDTVSWVPAGSPNALSISGLQVASQNSSVFGGGSTGGYILGGTGYFNVNAGSISLGNSFGILSVGNGSIDRADYSLLTPYISSGATINVTAGYLEMPGSTIAALGGGDVNVLCTGVIPDSPLNKQSVGVSMDLGSAELLPFEKEIMDSSYVGLGIYTSGGGNVSLTALGTINIDSSRVGSFNGGNVTVTSLTGDVNAGSGGTIAIPVNFFSSIYSFPYEPVEKVFVNGIVADTLDKLSDGTRVPGAAAFPGNITVTTPQGSIYADLGGILQEVLNGILPLGPTITLEAGTPNPLGDWKSKLPPLYGPPQEDVGDIDLGNSGVIGGTLDIKATGKVNGLVFSTHDANVTANSLGNLTVLAGGKANVTSQETGSGEGITIIGGQGVNASGIGSGANLLGQNVSVNGGSATSTLGSSASATSTSQSAAGVASSQAQQQTSSTDSGDDQNKKNKPQIHKIGRVTVVLSAAVPAR